MDLLTSLFPTNDFTLLGIILGLPLLGAFVNGVFGKRLGKEAVTLMALSVIGAAFIASVCAFCMLKDAQTGEAAVRFQWHAWTWFDVAGRADGTTIPIEVAFSLDALSGTMALIVTGVGFLIHLYSSKYMEDDPGYYRFFTWLNLFIFSMLVLILGDSLPILFVGWEGVGLCSYLLIGFWFGDDSNASAGKKAFITNRIGDFGLLVAMGLLVYYVGALDWDGIERGRASLLTPVKIWPVANQVPIAAVLPAGWQEAINTPRYVNGATLVGLALFLGCAGKSAQFPLYVWLPDAMAGPTPVSALIHAATMVTAGVYLVCRMSGVFVLSPAAMFTMALIGAFTAFFAATIALVQKDIKKVLAYSTVSQLGYMFLGVGVGAFTAGFFHVLTHAFFKACLFLGSGSVIHAMHARIHGTNPSQDMGNMGGLRKYMPVTFWTFAAAWAAIVGFPGTSGFFSKDEILLKANTSKIIGEEAISSGAVRIDNFAWPSWGPTVLYVVGAVTALMTAFYMTRLFIGIFFGEFKGWTIVKGWKPAHAGHGHDDHGHDDHEEPGPAMEGPEPHESPWQMTLPLIVLGGLSVLGGFFSAHILHLHPLDDFINPVFAGAQARVELIEGHQGHVLPLLGLAVVAFIVGCGLAYWMYVLMKGAPAQQMAEKFPRLYAIVYDKWRVDEFYQETILGAVDSLADICVWFDKWVVDGILARASAFTVQVSGSLLRYFQTGRLQAYAAVMVVGLAVIGWFVVAPHASAKPLANHSTGQYSVTAAPGFGYSYRWDLDGDEAWDDEFSDQRQIAFGLNVDEARTVRLEVKNAFGQTSEREFDFARPKPDMSGVRIDVSRGADGRLHGAAQPGNAAPPSQREQGLPQGHPPVAGPDAERIKRALERGMNP